MVDIKAAERCSAGRACDSTARLMLAGAAAGTR